MFRPRVGCPAHVPQMSRICPVSYKERDIYGTYMGHPGDIHCFRQTCLNLSGGSGATTQCPGKFNRLVVGIWNLVFEIHTSHRLSDLSLPFRGTGGLTYSPSAPPARSSPPGSLLRAGTCCGNSSRSDYSCWDSRGTRPPLQRYTMSSPSARAALPPSDP